MKENSGSASLLMVCEYAPLLTSAFSEIPSVLHLFVSRVTRRLNIMGGGT